MTVLNGDCQDEIRSDVTKADCCASIGKAWGSPCEVCPTPGVDGGGPGTLVEPTPGIGVGPDGGPPLRPGACFEGFFSLSCGTLHHQKRRGSDLGGVHDTNGYVKSASK